MNERDKDTLELPEMHPPATRDPKFDRAKDFPEQLAHTLGVDYQGRQVDQVSYNTQMAFWDTQVQSVKNEVSNFVVGGAVFGVLAFIDGALGLGGWLAGLGIVLGAVIWLG